MTTYQDEKADTPIGRDARSDVPPTAIELREVRFDDPDFPLPFRRGGATRTEWRAPQSSNRRPIAVRTGCADRCRGLEPCRRSIVDRRPGGKSRRAV